MLLRQFTIPVLPPAFRYPLEDGTPVLVRPLRPDDAQRLRDGFRRLSTLARRRNNFGETGDLPEDRIALLTTANPDAQAWGAANMNKPDEPGIGVARYIRINGERDLADVAITIADSYQGKGAGTLLHACLHVGAYRAGVRRFTYDVARDNERFSQQLRSLGAEFTGRAENIERWVMPVYRRLWDLPTRDANGRRFAAAFRRLHEVEAVDA